MYRYLLLVMMTASTAYAVEPAMKADAAYGVRYTQERVVDLPQDQETPYLTIFAKRNDPKAAQVVKWFADNPTLAGLKSQTHWQVIYTDSPIYQRFATGIPALPCIRLQAHNTELPVAEFAGNQVPMSADALAKGLNNRATDCFRRQCPVPAPMPIPDPEPAPLPVPAPAPKPSFPWLPLGILTIAGAAAGVAIQWRKTHKG